MNINAGHINRQTTERQLQDFFTSFVVAEASKMINKEYSGKSKGYEFVKMPNQKVGEAAVVGLNGFDIDGLTIVIKKARQNNKGNNYNMFLKF